MFRVVDVYGRWTGRAVNVGSLVAAGSGDELTICYRVLCIDAPPQDKGITPKNSQIRTVRSRLRLLTPSTLGLQYSGCSCNYMLL